jgi:hypothetical protein
MKYTFQKLRIGIEHSRKLCGYSCERMDDFLFATDRPPPLLYRSRDHFLRNQKQIPIFIFMFGCIQTIYWCVEELQSEAVRFGCKGEQMTSILLSIHSENKFN